jgi:prolyl oligopeptidase
MYRSAALVLASLLSAPSPAASQATPPAPQASPDRASTPALIPGGVAAAPRAARRPVVDTYHGVQVTDPYRWLEDPKDPEVVAWTAAQATAARGFLDGLVHAKAVHAQVEAIIKAFSDSHVALQVRPTGLFAIKIDRTKQQPELVLLPSADAPQKARSLVDPNRLDGSGKTTIDFYVPSLDGKRVAVSLSSGGTESGDVHVYDVASGKEIGEVLTRVQGGTAGGSVAWNADGTGLWYTRYPREGERAKEDLAFFQQLWFHKLGTPVAGDRRDLMVDLPRIAEIALETRPDGRWILALVKNGDGGEVEYFVRPAGTGSWTQISTFEDKVVGAAFGDGAELFLLSRQGAPRGKVLSLSLPPGPGALASARLVIPEGDGAIQEVLATRSRLYLSELDGGLSRLRVTDLTGKARGLVPILPVSNVDQLVRVGADDLLFTNVSYLMPFAWYRLAAATGAVTRTRLAVRSPVDLSTVEAVRGFATSKDGTRVPVDVLRLAGTKLDGSAPTILYGYGGYGISQTPYYSGSRALWLLNGGVLAFAGIRGGGEYGDAWHLAGALTMKQNCFDDFIASAEWLVKEGYTRPERLGILGGSNGGILMGASMAQRPELFRAVVTMAGIYDMLRVETTSNGAFNVTEYGTVKDPEQFKALYAYSPLHAMRDGVRYPAVMITAGENDPRVDSWQGKKLAARLQEATASGQPVILRMSGWGHGMGSSRDELIDEYADLYAFFVEELGLAFKPVPVKTPKER